MLEVGRPFGWTPRSIAQEALLDSIGVVDFALFGGAAGSTKTESLLVDASQEYTNPNLHSLVIRKTFKEIELDIEPKSHKLYSQMGATYNQSKRRWEWPWGSAIQFGYLESEKDIYRYYGSEFSCMEFDESTFHVEQVVRHLMTMRLRSKDPSLKLRVRLGTNPGNVGGEWHKSIFMGPHCTHCMITDESKLPWKIYNDAKWPSDMEPIVGSDSNSMSTIFIPGRLTDHNLLIGYEQRLKGLPERLRKALLEGCWESWEGQYYTCWDPRQHCIKWESSDKDVGLRHFAKWWWTYWVSCDYGFGSSRTSAHLHCKSPEGKTYTIDEILLQHIDAPDTALYIKNRWADLVDSEGNKRKIAAWFLSPDAFRATGLRGQGGHTIGDQMLEASKLPWEMASNDRIGGSMLMYSMLQSNKWAICSDTCSNLVKAIPSRVHDPDRQEDVLKVKGDPLDDIWDDARYGLYSFAQSPRKPKEILIAEAITATDPFAAHMQWLQARSKFKPSKQFISYRTNSKLLH